MAGDRHDENVPYVEVIAPAGSVDLDAWQCWTETDRVTTHYYAAGPCPACGAPSQGHLADATVPIESLGADTRPPPPRQEPVEIPLRCTCGYPHGHDSATSCGRRWSIICPSQQP